MKAARAVTVAGVLGFLLLTGVSALRYPGGTQANRSSEGYAFFGNYWCDLYRSQALNGEDHAVGALLAQVGALAYGMGVPAIQKVVTLLILVWLVVVALTPRAAAMPTDHARER